MSEEKEWPPKELLESYLNAKGANILHVKTDFYVANWIQEVSTSRHHIVLGR